MSQITDQANDQIIAQFVAQIASTTGYSNLDTYIQEAVIKSLKIKTTIEAHLKYIEESDLFNYLWVHSSSFREKGWELDDIEYTDSQIDEFLKSL